MNELVEIFYKNGNGVFLSPKISDLLFEYRGIVYGLMYATKNNESERIEIQKKETVEKMLQIKNELSKTIRENINLKSRDLLSIED
ncbi:MAG: CRISPR-associated protein Csx28 [Capnocytophaga felis]|nr:CRISPR-associated protein Csx28 [Capnocytophaga felis]